jgi:hypothetical protein
LSDSVFEEVDNLNNSAFTSTNPKFVEVELTKCEGIYARFRVRSLLLSYNMVHIKVIENRSSLKINFDLIQIQSSVLASKTYFFPHNAIITLVFSRTKEGSKVF